MITSLWYGYSNSATATNSHVIKIYDVVSPSATHGTATTTFAGFSKGALLTAVTLTALPSGQNFVTVGINSVQAGGSAVWVKFEELDNGSGAYPATLWLTGGTPSATGYTHPGVTFTLKDYYPTYYGGTFTYNTFAAFPRFTFPDGYGGYFYTHANIAVGLGGYHVPGPAAISLLGLGGLLVLRRRRVWEGVR